MTYEPVRATPSPFPFLPPEWIQANLLKRQALEAVAADAANHLGISYDRAWAGLELVVIQAPTEVFDPLLESPHGWREIADGIATVLGLEAAPLPATEH